MANVLGNLIVSLGIVTSPFEKGVQAATKQIDSFQKSLKKFSDSTLANVLSLGALTAGVKASLDQASAFERVTNELAASARIAGQDLGALNSIVAQGHDKFGLSKTMATEFAVEISKLADKTGGLKD